LRNLDFSLKSLILSIGLFQNLLYGENQFLICTFCTAKNESLQGLKNSQKTEKQTAKTVRSGICMSIAFETTFLLTNFIYFFKLQVNAAIKTCLLASSIPRVFTRFIFRKLINVPSTGSTVEDRKRDIRWA
jgi:hypothetical protein